MTTYKHFSLPERIDIEHLLREGYSFKAIGKELNRDCTTIAKEVKKHKWQKLIEDRGINAETRYAFHFSF